MTTEIPRVNPAAGRKAEKPGKLKQLLEYLLTLKQEKFTGYIKVNYSQGHIARVEKFEEVLKE